MSSQSESQTVDPLTPEERQGMTIWGEAISAQIRDYSTVDDDLHVTGSKRVLILHVMDGAPREQGDVAIPAGDMDKLRALLGEAVTR